MTVVRIIIKTLFHRETAPLPSLAKSAPATSFVGRILNDRFQAETVQMLAWAEQHRWIAGVIGWVDLLAPDANERVAWLASAQRAVGLRN